MSRQGGAVSKKTPRSTGKTPGTLEAAWPRLQQQASSPGSESGTDSTTPRLSELQQGLAEMKEWLAGTLKDFQVGMQQLVREEIATLRTDMQKGLEAHKKEVEALGERVGKVEEAMSPTLDNLKAIQHELDDIHRQNAHLFSKCEDMENRERRANVRVRGIEEGAEGTDTILFVQGLFESLIPTMTNTEFELIRAHRVGPLRKDGNKAPRDILAKLYRYDLKEKLLQEARNSVSLMYNEMTYELFQDLAPSTLLRRAALRPVTQELQARKVRYKWTFPFGLAFTLDGRSYHIGTLAEGSRILNLGAEQDTDGGTPHGPFRGAIPWPWTVVTKSRARPGRRQRHKEDEGTEGAQG